MLILALIILPLVASLCCLLPGKMPVHKVALISSLVILGMTIYSIVLYTTDLTEGLAFDVWWIQKLGISFSLGMDGISLLLVSMTNFLLPLIILVSFRNNYAHQKAFYSLIFLMQAALIGVFTSLDGFLFYVFWELALIPIYFICMIWGGADRIRITLKFFIYTLAGSLLMLLGLIYVYLHTPGEHSFAISSMYNATLSEAEQSWLFWLFFIAFAVKIPIFPLHTWQPDTYTDAPVEGTMLLSGIMLKMGTYGILRWLLPVLPLGVLEWKNVALALTVTGIIYASLMALVQKDFKRLLAYSSIAHVGLISAGIFSLNITGLQGAMVQMIAHAVNVTGVFFIAEIIQRRMKTRMLNELGGIAHNAPLFSGLFMMIMLGSVALPLTNGFVGEFLLLCGIYQYNAIIAAVAGLSVILGAVYMFRAYQSIMFGEQHDRNNEFTGLHASEKIVLITLVAIIVITGIYPQPIMDIAEPALENIIINVKQVYY